MDDFLYSPELIYEMLSYLSTKELISILPVSKEFYALGFELLSKKAIQGEESARSFMINYLKSCYPSLCREYHHPKSVQSFVQSLLSNPIGSHEKILAYVITLHLMLQNKIHLSNHEFHFALLKLQSAYLNPSTQLIAIWGFYIILRKENPAIKAIFKNSYLWTNSLIANKKFSWFRKEMSLEAMSKQFFDLLIMQVNDYHSPTNKRALANYALSYFLPHLSLKRKKTLLEYAINQLFHKSTIRSSLYRQEIKLTDLLPFIIRFLLLNMEHKTAIKYYREIVNEIIALLVRANLSIIYLKKLYPLYHFCLAQCKDVSNKTGKDSLELSELFYSKIQSHENQTFSFPLSFKNIEQRKKEYFSSEDLEKSLRGFIVNKRFFSHDEKIHIASLYFPRVIAKRGAIYSSFIKSYKNYISESEIAIYYQTKLNQITARNYMYYEKIYSVFSISARMFCERLLELITDSLSPLTFQRLFYCSAEHAHLLDDMALHFFAEKMCGYFYKNNNCIEINFLSSLPVYERLIDTFFDYFLHFYQESKLIIKLNYLRNFINIYPVLQEVNQEKIAILLKEILQLNKTGSRDNSELGLALRMSNINRYTFKQLKTLKLINSQLHPLLAGLDRWMEGDFEPIIQTLKVGFTCPFHIANDLFCGFLVCQKIAVQYLEISAPALDLGPCKKIWESDYPINIKWHKHYFVLALYYEHLISERTFMNAFIQCLLPYQNDGRTTQLQQKYSINLQNFIKNILYQDKKYITAIVLQNFHLLPALFHFENSARLLFALLKESLKNEQDNDKLWGKKKIQQLRCSILEHDEEKWNKLTHTPKHRNPSKFSFFMQKIKDIPKECLFIHPQLF